MSKAREAGGEAVTLTIRVTPENRRKIERTAKRLGSCARLSAGVRWLIDNAPEAKAVEASNAQGK